MTPVDIAVGVAFVTPVDIAVGVAIVLAVMAVMIAVALVVANDQLARANPEDDDPYGDVWSGVPGDE